MTVLLLNADNNGLHRFDNLLRAWRRTHYRYDSQLLVLRLCPSVRWLWCQDQEEAVADGWQDQAHSAYSRCTSACWTHRVSYQSQRYDLTTWLIGLGHVFACRNSATVTFTLKFKEFMYPVSLLINKHNRKQYKRVIFFVNIYTDQWWISTTSKV